MTLDSLRARRAFLLDLDGTIYLGARAIEGAAEFVQFLRESGRKHLFFTNNSSTHARNYAEKLTRLGIPTSPAEVLTSGEATLRFLRNQTPYRRLYVVGTPAFEDEVTMSGFTIANADVDAVVLAFDRTLTYEKLERACNLLRQNVPYFATNPDRVCPTEQGYIPDCGSIAALLREATGREPRYIGKPNAEMVRAGMDLLGATPDMTVMVGDRIYTDIQMAHNAGTLSVLVLSGETTAATAESADPKPDFVFPSVRELMHALRA